MTYADLKSQLIRQALQLHLPQSHSAAIATPAIRGDQQLAGVSIDRLTHLSPPPSNRFDGKLGRVVGHPHTHPALVGCEIIHPIGGHLAQLRIREVMHPHRFGSTFGLPFLPGTGKITHQFLLLGVHGNDWLARPQKFRHLPGDVLKLGIAMRCSAPSRLLRTLCRLYPRLPNNAHTVRWLTW